MEGLDLTQAISLLRQNQACPLAARGSRELLVAFTTLHTFCHHWPSQESAEYRELLKVYEFLKIEEYDRFLKQRRIALRKLSASLPSTLAWAPKPADSSRELFTGLE